MGKGSQPRRKGFRHSAPQHLRLEVEELEARLIPASNPPTLSWAPITGAFTYDVCVSDLTTRVSPIARNTDVTGTSWTVFRPLNPNDTFMWWVRGISGTGSPGPWSVGIEFTVTALPSPTLVSPISTTLTGLTVTFTWSPINGADSYDVWVNDISSGQSQFARNTEIAGTSWTPFNFVTPGDSYVWWVRASSGNLDYSAWSSSATFSVIGVPVTFPPTPPLAPPTSLNLTGSSIQPTYNWSLVSGAEYYDLWVSDRSNQTIAVRTQVNSLSFASRRSLISGDTYEWWVRGYSSNGIPGPWSTGYIFGTISLNTPILIGPSGQVNGAPLLTWTSVSGANFYDVWIDDLTSGVSQVERTQVTGTSLIPTLLPSGHTFEWWVRAYTSGGGLSDWSAPLIFNIV